MTLETVIANLENTIQGKQALLRDIDFYSGTPSSTASSQYTREFLRININELNRILSDLKKVKV
jgi:hypothetical protein